ncbi:hypothetical protein QBC36DRAFT_323398, partial [Triangularia setosa]
MNKNNTKGHYSNMTHKGKNKVKGAYSWLTSWAKELFRVTIDAQLVLAFSYTLNFGLESKQRSQQSNQSNPGLMIGL